MNPVNLTYLISVPEERQCRKLTNLWTVRGVPTYTKLHALLELCEDGACDEVDAEVRGEE